MKYITVTLDLAVDEIVDPDMFGDALLKFLNDTCFTSVFPRIRQVSGMTIEPTKLGK